MWIFGSATEKKTEEKKWNNDEKPSHESVLWRFRTLKNIREGNVPCLRKATFEKKLEIIPVSYKIGTTELCRTSLCPSPSIIREEGEVCSSGDGSSGETEGHKKARATKLKKKKRRKTKRNRGVRH